jgi:hypothetical protein
LGALLGVSLLFTVVVTTVRVVDLADTVRCDDTVALQEEERAAGPGEEVECYEGGKTQKTVTVVAGFAAGVVGLIAAAIAFWGAATRNVSRALLPLTFATLILGGLALVLNV